MPGKKQNNKEELRSILYGTKNGIDLEDKLIQRGLVFANLYMGAISINMDILIY
jgi:hypothetical protein